MGFLDALTVGAPIAAKVVGDYEHAQAQGADKKSQQIIQALQIKRQQQEDALKQAIADRQAKSAGISDALNTYKLQHPTIDPNSQEAIDRRTQSNIQETHEKIDYHRTHGYHAPQQNYQFMQSVDPATGQAVYAKGNRVTGDLVPTTVPGKPGGGGGGAQGAQVPVADMEQRYQEIAGHAHDLGAGKWNITRGMQSREGLDYGVTRENAQGKPSLTHMGTSALLRGFDLGGEDYGKYQALMNSTRALGDDVAKVFKGRQNEESVIREVALSELTPDDYNNPDVVEQKLSRLRHIIALAKVNNPAQAGLSNHPAPSGGGHTVSDADLWEQYVNQGLSAEQATAKVQARNAGGQ